MHNTTKFADLFDFAAVSGLSHDIFFDSSLAVVFV